MANTKERQRMGLAALKATSSPYVVGIDEVGTGCLAGPFVVSAVVCRKEWSPSRSTIRDSKKCSPKQRGEVVRYLVPPNIEDSWIIKVEPDEFPNPGDLHRKLKATILTIGSYALLSYPDSIVVVDGDYAPYLPNCLAFPKADDLVPAVSAASIIAKVFRDDLMVRYSTVYPGYGFENHKGYGTAEHQEAIARLGLCPLHRRGYAPIRAFLAEQQRQFEKLVNYPNEHPSRA